MPPQTPQRERTWAYSYNDLGLHRPMQRCSSTKQYHSDMINITFFQVGSLLALLRARQHSSTTFQTCECPATILPLQNSSFSNSPVTIETCGIHLLTTAAREARGQCGRLQNCKQSAIYLVQHRSQGILNTLLRLRYPQGQTQSKHFVRALPSNHQGLVICHTQCNSLKAASILPAPTLMEYSVALQP